jgi:7,8-dihydropterin-6-yl-methyl-4-(beta-D-ribofuranosyl)aminobenzene 5'-phosphate synthase
MKIKILFDRDAINESFRTGWGVAFLIGEKVLFDTSEKFEYLKENARLAKVDLSKIEQVVISHDHWDHINGLWGLLEMNKNITVYASGEFNPEFKDKVKAAGGKLELVKHHMDIGGGLHILGNNRVMYKGQGMVEQMLFIKNENKLAMVCGCCHPGVVNIIHKAGIIFGQKVDTIVGGLHMMDKERRFAKYMIDEMGMFVEKVFASHCTGHDACKILQEKYKDNFAELKAGMEIEV